MTVRWPYYVLRGRVSRQLICDFTDLLHGHLMKLKIQTQNPENTWNGDTGGLITATYYYLNDSFYSTNPTSQGDFLVALLSKLREVE